MDSVGASVAMIALGAAYMSAVAVTMSIAHSWRSTARQVSRRARDAEQWARSVSAHARSEASHALRTHTAAERDGQRAAIAAEAIARGARDDVDSASRRLDRTRELAAKARRHQRADALRIRNGAAAVMQAAELAHDASVRRAAVVRTGLSRVQDQVRRIAAGSVSRDEMDREARSVRRGLAAAALESGRSVEDYHKRVDEMLKAAEEADLRAEREISRRYATRAELEGLVRDVRRQIGETAADRDSSVERAKAELAQRVAAYSREAGEVRQKLSECESKVAGSLSGLDESYLEDLTSLHDDMLREVSVLRTQLSGQQAQLEQTSRSVAGLAGEGRAARDAADLADRARAEGAAALRALVEDELPSLATREQLGALAARIGDPADSRGSGLAPQVARLSGDIAAAKAAFEVAEAQCRESKLSHDGAVVLPAGSRLAAGDSVLIIEKGGIFVCASGAADASSPTCTPVAVADPRS